MLFGKELNLKCRNIFCFNLGGVLVMDVGMVEFRKEEFVEGVDGNEGI